MTTSPEQPVPSLADAAVQPARQTSNVIDLDAQREQRAAAREGRREDMPLRVGGKVVAVLPVELPIDVLEPLRTLDEEFTLILRSAMQVARAGGDAATKWDATQLVVDVLASNPALPVQVLDVISQVARNLLTDAGYEALMDSRPTREDLQYLATSVLGFYGVSLGESSPLSGSPAESGGETSSTTSEPTSTDSTPAISTPTPATPDTSESAAS